MRNAEPRKRKTERPICGFEADRASGAPRWTSHSYPYELPPLPERWCVCGVCSGLFPQDVDAVRRTPLELPEGMLYCCLQALSQDARADSCNRALKEYAP